MQHTESHSSILTWRGSTVRLDPPAYHYVYILHYRTAHHHAQHYTGSTGALDYRLRNHQQGASGARLPQVFHDEGIPFTLARLWRFESAEAAFSFERTVKRRHEGPRLCPICQGKPFDDLVFMRQGHQRLAWRMVQGRRRPMPITRNRPMC